MGWFDEQIKTRVDADNEVFSDSIEELAEAAGKRVRMGSFNKKGAAKNAIDRIIKYYHFKPGSVPESVKDFESQLEYLLRPHGIMRRGVVLTSGWYKDAVGPMLGFMEEDDTPVALIPGRYSGYVYIDPSTGKGVKINAKTEKLLKPDAICFYKPLPLHKIGLSDLMRFILEALSFSDILALVMSIVCVTVVGLFIPKLTLLLVGDAAESKSLRIIAAVGVFMICATISHTLFTSVRQILEARLQAKISTSAFAATMMRVLAMPAPFFRKYTAGELTERVVQVKEFCSEFVTAVLGTGLTAALSLVYIVQIRNFAPALVSPALIIIAVTVAFALVTARFAKEHKQHDIHLAAEESGLSFELINGISKIRVAGAEKRAFARWAEIYARQTKVRYQPPAILTLNSAINTAISLAGTIIIYYITANSGVPVDDYYAFNSAYAYVAGAFTELAEVAIIAAELRPRLEMAKPILENIPEMASGKEVVTSLSGDIEVSHVSFKYEEHSPEILKGMSFRIKSGQYVAIVGRTGCGKTTLMRLLLGFEMPDKGTIYYGGKDITHLDLKSLRKNIGVVSQDDKLFAGDIYSNIVICAPQLGVDSAWRAAEIAGIADDIRKMPLGMNTYITEGSGGISGGQKQRIMIARAVAPGPKILIFDEATSALDNMTQKKVSQALDSLNCTRIVIAHRLSTIKNCDRILVMDDGRIVEDGTYDELVAKKGLFVSLIEHQRIESWGE